MIRQLQIRASELLWQAYEEETGHLPLWWLRFLYRLLDDWRFAPYFRSWKPLWIGHYEYSDIYQSINGTWYRSSTWIPRPWPKIDFYEIVLDKPLSREDNPTCERFKLMDESISGCVDAAM